MPAGASVCRRCLASGRLGCGGIEHGIEAGLQGTNSPTRRRHKIVQHLVASLGGMGVAQELLSTPPFGDRLRLAFLDPQKELRCVTHCLRLIDW